jgi:hypothetical protein
MNLVRKNATYICVYVCMYICMFDGSLLQFRANICYLFRTYVCKKHFLGGEIKFYESFLFRQKRDRV